MASELTMTFDRLSDTLARAPAEPIEGRKYVAVSDIHLGDGGSADDFRGNEEILGEALGRYKDEGYTLILLGDIEELWQFDLVQVRARYGQTIYRRMKAFGQGQVIRIFGNHDIEWGSPPDPAMSGSRRCYGAPEGLKLTDAAGETALFLVHGHQGTPDSDKHSWVSRFAVRAGWKPAERLLRTVGVLDSPEETKSRVTKGFEQIRYAWAKQQGILLICGHTHRAIFASKSRAEELEEEIEDLQAKIHSDPGAADVTRWLKEIRKLHRVLLREQNRGRDIDPMEDDPLPCYFNTGCGLYEGGITAIEIDGTDAGNDDLRLVKWHGEQTGAPQRKVLAAGNLAAYRAAVEEWTQ